MKTRSIAKPLETIRIQQRNEIHSAIGTIQSLASPAINGQGGSQPQVLAAIEHLKKAFEFCAKVADLPQAFGQLIGECDQMAEALRKGSPNANAHLMRIGALCAEVQSTLNNPAFLETQESSHSKVYVAFCEQVLVESNLETHAVSLQNSIEKSLAGPLENIVTLAEAGALRRISAEIVEIARSKGKLSPQAIATVLQQIPETAAKDDQITASACQLAITVGGLGRAFAQGSAIYSTAILQNQSIEQMSKQLEAIGAEVRDLRGLIHESGGRVEGRIDALGNELRHLPQSGHRPGFLLSSLLESPLAVEAVVKAGEATAIASEAPEHGLRYTVIVFIIAGLMFTVNRWRTLLTKRVD